MEEIPSVRQIRKIRAAAVIAAKIQKMAEAAFRGSEVETELWLAHDAAVATLLQSILNEDGVRALDAAEADAGLRGVLA